MAPEEQVEILAIHLASITTFLVDLEEMEDLEELKEMAAHEVISHKVENTIAVVLFAVVSFLEALAVLVLRVAEVVNPDKALPRAAVVVEVQERQTLAHWERMEALEELVVADRAERADLLAVMDTREVRVAPQGLQEVAEVAAAPLEQELVVAEVVVVAEI